MASGLALDVADWAALLCGETTERLGAAGESDVIPANYRRRLPGFARNALRCALPLLADAPGMTVVFSSPAGDLGSAAALLSDIARRELLSPTIFSLSVHNAPAGVLSLCVSGPGDHTAIAAGRDSLAAGLVEAYGRLHAGAETILLLHAEEQPAGIYADCDSEGAPGVFLALKLKRGAAGEAAFVAPGRTGAAATVRALEHGARRIAFSPPAVKARAA